MVINGVSAIRLAVRRRNVCRVIPPRKPWGEVSKILSDDRKGIRPVSNIFQKRGVQEGCATRTFGIESRGPWLGIPNAKSHMLGRLLLFEKSQRGINLSRRVKVIYWP